MLVAETVNPWYCIAFDDVSHYYCLVKVTCQLSCLVVVVVLGCCRGIVFMFVHVFCVVHDIVFAALVVVHDSWLKTEGMLLLQQLIHEKYIFIESALNHTGAHPC